ncbi:DUF1684 domain-containing protein [Deinococcus aestuarii]|uniref:DUF1684 domain-containing protein n=1 Tax=Deinococcus aestuarii TaxID=2774531 RepID=UPI001C0CE367|nr:DUF1684 domain-containing protein [Deinococcus aestuarii]
MPDDARDVAAERRDREAYFRNEVLTDDERPAFTGTRYFEVDDRYVFRLRPDWLADPETVELSTSKGQNRPYLRSARVSVPFPEGEAELTIFSSLTEPAHAFIPFRDATSGRETYGAARYLEVKREDDWVTLDFNRTYNPYCAYGDRWNCTLPPAENMLSVLVPVGEKRYRDAH